MTLSRRFLIATAAVARAATLLPSAIRTETTAAAPRVISYNCKAGSRRSQCRSTRRATARCTPRYAALPRQVSPARPGLLRGGARNFCTKPVSCGGGG